MTSQRGRYHEIMKAITISEIINRVPAAKLTTRFASTEPEMDVAASLPGMLSQPVDFPTLDQAILSEDTVCIPVEPGIPDEAAIAAGVTRAVHDLGVGLEQITILLPEGTGEESLAAFREALQETGCSEVEVRIHDSTRAEHLGYLGPSESGEPITLNARLVHADFVLPIARAKSSGWKRDLDFLYPYFSDRESQQRFFALSPDQRIGLNHEVHRWLGNCFQVSVATRETITPAGAPASTIGTALLGETRAVNQAIRDHFQQQTETGEHPCYELVIARVRPHLCLSGEEIGELVTDLMEWCTATGSIVLLWDDSQRVPRLVDLESRDDEWDRFPGLDFGDRSCFLATDQELLHRTGLPTITDLAELENLVENHGSVLVIPDFINDFACHQAPCLNRLDSES